MDVGKKMGGMRMPSSCLCFGLKLRADVGASVGAWPR